MVRRATIKSLARELGVSHMTVSRALSGHPRVSEKTRVAILARAEAVGYVRSQAAVTIRGAASGILGLLLPGLLNEFYARLAHQLSLLAAAEGYHLVTHLTDEDPARQSLALQKLVALGAEAAAVVAPPDSVCNGEPLPIVSLVRQVDGIRRFVGIDDREAILAAVARIAARGATRIAYVGGTEKLPTGRARHEAFQAGLAAAGLQPHNLARLGPPQAPFGRAAMGELLEQGIDGVVCGGVETTRGAVELCLERGIGMPSQLAFVGYGDAGAYRYLSGGITVIALPVEAVARRALDLLAGRTVPDKAAEATLITRATA